MGIKTQKLSQNPSNNLNRTKKKKNVGWKNFFLVAIEKLKSVFLQKKISVKL